MMDLTGQRFGKLVVIARERRDDRATWWLCQCDCGKRNAVRAYVLRGGDARSCGCARRNHLKHGLSDSPEAFAWSSMRQRCTNPKDPGYKNYGARGITVCDRWLNSFEAFYADMGPRPPGCSIDRTNNDGPYSPENCRWVPRVAQANNKRRNRRLTLGGRTYTVAEAARKFAIRPSTLKRRLDLGWTPERAVSS